MAHFHIAVIGSEFGGLGTAIRLKREGIDNFVVLERAADVGGTWRDNTYPGCACDNSVVYMTEGQIEHFIGAVRHMRRHKLEPLEPAVDAQAAYVAGVDRRMRGTVWVDGGCASWYLDRTGRHSTLWPDSSWSFYRRVAAFNPREYVTQRQRSLQNAQNPQRWSSTSSASSAVNVDVG